MLTDKSLLEQDIVEKLKTCYDPEIPVDIFELGLIYEIEIDDNANVLIKMTLTSPACPVAGTLPFDVQEKVLEVQEVKNVLVQLVWDPPWTKDRMSEVAKLQLDMF